MTNSLDYDLMDISPSRGSTQCIVYAVDTPTYQNFQGIYGEGFSRRVQGSLIIISGGYSRPAKSVAGCREFFLEGSTILPNRIGCQFIEHVLEPMIAPDDHVVYLLDVSLEEAAQSAINLRYAGFEIIETGVIWPGYINAYALCLGSGSMLKGIEWLHPGMGNTYALLATSGVQGSLEAKLVQAARNKSDVIQVLRDQVEEISAHPETILEKLGDYNLFVLPTDPHDQSVQIHRRDINTSSIQSLFGSVAEQIGLILYDAGSLHKQSKKVGFFTDYTGWEQWRPLPSHWKLVLTEQESDR